MKMSRKIHVPDRDMTEKIFLQGNVRREVVVAFRQRCADDGRALGASLEEAIQMWLVALGTLPQEAAQEDDPLRPRTAQGRYELLIRCSNYTEEQARLLAFNKSHHAAAWERILVGARAGSGRQELMVWDERDKEVLDWIGWRESP